VERSRLPGSEYDKSGQPPAAAASTSPGEVVDSGQADRGGCAGWKPMVKMSGVTGRKWVGNRSSANPLVPPGGSPEFSDVVLIEQEQVQPEEQAAQVESADPCVDALPQDGSDKLPFRRPLLAGRPAGPSVWSSPPR